MGPRTLAEVNVICKMGPLPPCRVPRKHPVLGTYKWGLFRQRGEDTIVWGFGGSFLILVAKVGCVDHTPGLRFLLASKVRRHLPLPARVFPAWVHSVAGGPCCCQTAPVPSDGSLPQTRGGHRLGCLLSPGSAAQEAGGGQSQRGPRLGPPAQDPQVPVPAGQSRAALQHGEG